MTYLLLMHFACIVSLLGVVLWVNHIAYADKMVLGGGVAFLVMYLLI